MLEALEAAAKRRKDEGVLEDTALMEESIFTAGPLDGEVQNNSTEAENVQIYMRAAR